MPVADVQVDAQAMDDQGLLLVERLLDARQVEAARQAVDTLMDEPTERYRWIRQRTYEWFGRFPIFVELIEHPRVIALARAWLGEDFHLIAAQCSRNTREDPYAPGAMAIHQDACFFPTWDRHSCLSIQTERNVSQVGQAFPPVNADRQECLSHTGSAPAYRTGFSAMWYLQDTPLEMGPTQLLAGSHRDGRRWTDDTLPADRLFRQAIPAGSLLLFCHHTWHRGQLNSTGRPRDLITNAYAVPAVGKVQLGTPQADGSERYVEPTALLTKASDVVRQLLRRRD